MLVLHPPCGTTIARVRRESFISRLLFVVHACLIPLAMLVGSAQAVHAQETWTTLPSITTSDTTGEKPQSKVWFHGHTWWAVLPTTAITPTGSWLFRLEPNNTWTPVLQLTSLRGKADTKAIGNLTHVLIAGPTTSQVVSIEYVPASNTYQLWSVRPTPTPVTVGETGTIAIDSTGKMWLATESLTFVEVYHSDYPYTSFSGPITLATDTDGGDINAVVALPNNTIGVFWSNFALQRFGFRVHVDGTNPTVWLDDETPALAFHPSQNMADDHLNLAVGSDGTLYAAVKAGHASSSVPLLYLLVRHPQPGGPGGTWDDVYGFSSNGTRPIVVLNEDIQKLRVFYSASGGIFMRESNRWPISFGGAEQILSGTLNDPTSTKDIWSGRLVVLASGGSTSGVLITTVPGLVGYWKLDEGSGTQLKDSSGWGNPANITGSPSWVPVATGLAMTFNGSTHGVVSDQANLNATTALSLAAWVKPNQLATQDVISRATFGSFDGYALSLGSNGKAFVQFNQASVGDAFKLESSSSYPTSGNTWMHVAATYDGTTMRLYINGVQESSASGPAAIAASALSIGIGGQSNGSRRFRGDMDDVRVYNRALTPAEVATLAGNGPVKADLMVTKNDSVTTVYSGLTTVTYNIQVTNLGPSNVAAATVTDTVSSKLTGVTWTCTASSGSSCPASGSGSINHQISLEAGDSATYTLQGTVSASATGTLSNTASVSASGVNDPVPGNNSATDVDNIEQAVAPTISVQPANLTVTQPNSATFSVTASGTAPLSFQWRRNGAAISGATSSSYVLDPTSAASDNGAQYSVVVSNIAGNITSATATLTVNVAPGITTQPASITVNAPNSATFTVVASGTAPLSYQWRRNGSNISGATSASYVLNPTAGTDSGAQFSVVVTNAADSVTSANATLTVNVAPSITTQPANVTVTAPTAAGFSVVAAGTAPLSYQWRRNGVAISGATSSSYVLNPTAVSDSGAQFSVVVTNAVGSVTSASATLTVNPTPSAPSITTQPANTTVTAPAAASFSVVATGDAPLSYQWRRNGADISGATSASYVLNPTAVIDSGALFSVVVSNAIGNVTSSSATLTVQSGGGGGPIGPIFDVHFDSNADGFSYLDDQFRGTNQPNYASGNYIASGGFTGGALRVAIGGINSQNIANMSGGWRRSFTLANPTQLILSFRHRLTELPTYETDEYSQTLVSVDGVLFGVAPNDYIAQVVGGGPTTTGWQLVQLNLGTLSAGTHVLTLGGYNNQKTYPDESVEMLFDDVLLTDFVAVPPSITTQPANVTVTAPNAANFSVVATGDAPLSYQWRRNGVDISGATSSSYSLNPTAVSDSGALFSVRVTNGAGTVTSASATLTVNPAPVPPSITTQPSNVTVTAPNAANFSVVAAGDAPLSYQWRRNGVDIGGATNSSYSLSPTAVSDSGAQFSVRVTNAAGTVTSAAATLTVNAGAVPPSITTQPANATVTAPNAGDFSVVATGDAPLSYQWRRNGANISGATGANYSLNPTAVSDSGAQFDVVVSNTAGTLTSTAATLTVTSGGGGGGPIFDVHFNTNADGFTYQDDLFRSTNQPTFASGNYIASGGFTGGALRVLVGGVNSTLVQNMSGGWRRTFTLAVPTSLTLSFRHRLTETTNYESDEFSQTLVSVDGTLYGVAPNDYIAQVTGGGTSTTGWQLVQINLGTLAAGTHTLALGGYNNKKNNSNESAEVLIDDLLLTAPVPVPPSITTQPANLTVTEPGAANFSVVATGDAPLSYQWRRNGSNISGATSASYSLNPTAASDSGAQFDVVVSNATGTVTSTVATLTVNPAAVPPSITTQPANVTVTAPASAGFSVAAVGDAPLSYQWRRNGANISGATGATYELNPTAVSDSGAQFSVVVSNAAGTITSANAALTVFSGGGGEPNALFDVHFNSNADGFAYVDDLFRGTEEPSYASGAYIASGGFTGGALRVAIGGINSQNVSNMSGGWQRSFTLGVPTSVTLSFRYRLTETAEYEEDEFSQMLVSVDGVLRGLSPNDYIAQVVGGGPTTTGWRLVQIDLGTLGPGTHMVALGGYNNQKTYPDETVEVLIDDVAVLDTTPTPPSITTQPANITATEPAAASFSVVAAGPAPLAYQWRKNGVPMSGATSSSYVVDPTGVADNGAQFSVVVTNGGGSVTSASATLTVNLAPVPPSILSQPASVTVTAPGAANFSVVATGDEPMSYQWRRNGVDIGGATSSSYSLNPTAVADSGAQFSVRVTNAAGTVTSASATLTVNPAPVPPSITTQPANLTITAPNAANFSVVATGDAPLSYQWRRHGSDISGATSSSYALNPTAVADSGAQFDVVVSNAAGTVTSSAATLTVNPAPVPPSITTQPANLTVTAPNQASFSVVATGDAPLSYQWRRNGSDISGATSSSYVLNPTAVSDSGAQFDVVVTNGVGTITSAAATLTVNPTPVPPSITTQPAHLTVTAPNQASFSVVATGDAPLSYQWRRNGSDISGATSSSYVLNPTAVSDSGAQFDVVVTNAAGTVTSSAATLTVNPTPVPPSITTQPVNLTVTAPNQANFSVVATGDAPLSYQWRRNGSNISGATSSSYALNPTAVADSGAQFDAVVSNAAGTVTSSAATLTVNPAPVPPSITTQPANLTVTAPNQANFSVVATGDAPLSYQWRRNGSDISGATSSSYVLNPTAVSDSGAQFDVVVYNAAGTVTSSAATLTVNPSARAAEHHDAAGESHGDGPEPGQLLGRRNG